MRRGGVDLLFKGPLATLLEPQVQAWFREPGRFDIELIMICLHIIYYEIIIVLF